MNNNNNTMNNLFLIQINGNELSIDDNIDNFISNLTNTPAISTTFNIFNLQIAGLSSAPSDGIVGITNDISLNTAQPISMAHVPIPNHNHNDVYTNNTYRHNNGDALIQTNWSNYTRVNACDTFRDYYHIPQTQCNAFGGNEALVYRRNDTINQLNQVSSETPQRNAANAPVVKVECQTNTTSSTKDNDG
eukprot:17837_1